MTPEPGAICIFAKVPRAGHVKTRLARTLGDEKASALAAAFLEDTVASVLALPARIIVAFDEDEPDGLAGGAEVWNQGSGDLGERLERVLMRALKTHPWAVALGSDSPGLPLPLVSRALEALTSTDGPSAVLGPCEDGGFYLLGVRAIWAGVLRGVRWSTHFAYSDAEEALTRAAMKPAQLDAWFDVDEERDLEHLADLIDRGVVRACATAKLLKAG